MRYRFLNGITLADLVSRGLEKHAALLADARAAKAKVSRPR